MRSPSPCLAVLGEGVVGTACALALLAGSGVQKIFNPSFPTGVKSIEPKDRRVVSEDSPRFKSTLSLTAVSDGFALQTCTKNRRARTKCLPVVMISRSNYFSPQTTAFDPNQNRNSITEGGCTSFVKLEAPKGVSESSQNSQSLQFSSKGIFKCFPLGGSGGCVPLVDGDELLIKSYEEYISNIQRLKDEMTPRGFSSDSSSLPSGCSAAFFPHVAPTLCCCVPVSGLCLNTEKRYWNPSESYTGKSASVKSSTLHPFGNVKEEIKRAKSYSNTSATGVFDAVNVLKRFVDAHRCKTCWCECRRVALGTKEENQDSSCPQNCSSENKLVRESEEKGDSYRLSIQSSSMPSLRSSSLLENNILTPRSKTTTFYATTSSRAVEEKNKVREKTDNGVNETTEYSTQNLGCSRECGNPKNAVRDMDAHNEGNCLPSIPMVLVFTRGLMPDGVTPAEHILLHMNDGSNNSSGSVEKKNSIKHKCLRPSSSIAVLTVCGPLLPREWAHQNAALLQERAGIGKPENASSPPFLSTPALLSPYSGASFTVSLASSEEELTKYYCCRNPACYRSFPSIHDVLLRQVKRLFPRENISYFFGNWINPSFCSVDNGKDSLLKKESVQCFEGSLRKTSEDSFWTGGYVLGIVNGLLPLLSFGGGLVHSAYAVSSTSLYRCGLTETTTTGALFSYAQNAVVAAEQLLQGLWESYHCHRAKDEKTTEVSSSVMCSSRSAPFCMVSNLPKPSEVPEALPPLPPTVTSTIFLACLDHSSREFILGKQIDYHFRKDDALNAVFRSVAASVSWERQNRFKEMYGTKGENRMFDEIAAVDHHDGEGRIQTGVQNFAISGFSRSATQNGCTSFHSTSIASSVEGLSCLLEREKVHSSFFQALTETYHTVLRASLTGQRLVQGDEYAPAPGYSHGPHSQKLPTDPHDEAQKRETIPILSHSSTCIPHETVFSSRSSFPFLDDITTIDQTMLTGSAEELREASRDFAHRIKESSY